MGRNITIYFTFTCNLLHFYMTVTAIFSTTCMIGHDKHERLLNALTKSLMIFFILLSFGNVSSNIDLNTNK